MIQNQDLLEKMALPYYAHCQAKIAPALHSIAWNKIALAGFIELALLLKDVEPPSSYLRKIRAFYENYEQIAEYNPLLGDLDTISRNLNHLDKTNSNAVLAFALKWNNAVQALENYCFEQVSRRKINDSFQISESLQAFLFAIQDGSILPGWEELLEQQQLELAKMVQLRKLPSSTFAKVYYKSQFHGIIRTEQPWLKSWFQSDKDIQDILHILNKNFLRLINLINEKVPEPERQVKANPTEHISHEPSHDYRLTITYSYDGNDEGVYQANFFSLLRNFFK